MTYSRIPTATFLETLKAQSGNITETARVLGLSRPSVYRRASRLGVDVRGVRVAAGRIASGHIGRPPAPKTETHSEIGTFYQGRRGRTLRGVTKTAMAETEAPTLLRVQRTLSLAKKVSDDIDESSIDLTPKLRKHLSSSMVAELAIEIGLPLLRKQHGLDDVE